MTQPTTPEPDLTEAMEVWREAIDAASDSSIKFKTRADQAAARAIATALEARAHGERQAIETRFWAMVDRDGLTGLPSDMWAALDRLVKDRAAVSERDARIRELEGALEEILKVSVAGWENIWAGSNRCQAIARRALAKQEETNG